MCGLRVVCERCPKPLAIILQVVPLQRARQGNHSQNHSRATSEFASGFASGFCEWFCTCLRVVSLIFASGFCEWSFSRGISTLRVVLQILRVVLRVVGCFLRVVFASGQLRLRVVFASGFQGLSLVAGSTQVEPQGAPRLGRPRSNSTQLIYLFLGGKRTNLKKNVFVYLYSCCSTKHTHDRHVVRNGRRSSKRL